MSSLAEKITQLTNPAPSILDPEEDDNIDAAKVKIHNDDNGEILFSKSELRSRAAVLDNCVGKKVSRKSLSKLFHDDESENLDGFGSSRQINENDSDDNVEQDDDDDEEEEDDDDEADISDGDLENFKKSMNQQSLLSTEGDEESGESGDDDDDDDDDDESNESDAFGTESNEDLSNKFSNIDVTSELEKGAAVKAQQELWNRLCEARIKLQKLLLISNRLPQSDCWSLFKKNVGKDMQLNLSKGSNSVKFLLNNCLDLQSLIFLKNPEINNSESNVNQEVDKSHEEIPSDTDDEDVEGQKEKGEITPKKMLKRKLKCDEYGEIVAKRHKSLLPYRNSVIQKWDEKTKLSSGKITQKSFATFESSALKQIEQILQDESRLIKRTQLKRSLYKIIGKPEECEIKPEESEEKESTSKQDMLLRDYDTEIFDDEDFYRQLLRDVIESKSVGIDPNILRKQMEIQNVRNKIKKKVDTKASKGRKIRYDVHPKLVGFMKKMETSSLPDNARDNLLKCMFGKSYVTS